MPSVVWDQPGERSYEAGLDHGVLYFPDGGAVPWNGLTAVEEQSSTLTEPVYFDGVKFSDIVTYGNYEATIRAFTYPEEFLEYEGILEEQDGLYVANQSVKTFNLSYRTMTYGEEGYKIHLLWNLTAVPSTKIYETLSLEVTPTEFEWTITSVPEPVEGYRPTSHIILDSRRLDQYLLADIETILYGDPNDELRIPQMPTLRGFISYVRKWDRLIIIDNGDGTWTASVNTEGILTMLDETTFEITSDTATYLDADTYTITSSEKNEEDI